MATLQIIGGAPSNYVWTTRIACEEKGVPYELVSVAPHSPEVKAVSPIGKIPVMRHGDVALYEAKAICAYVDRTFPGPSLVPADPVGMAQVEQWVSCVNTTIDIAMMRQYAIAYIFPGTADKQPDRARVDAALPALEKAFAIVEAGVAKTGHLVGDSFTLADMFLAPILFYMKRFPESAEMLAGHAATAAYIERHLARPSVVRSTPPPRKA